MSKKIKQDLQHPNWVFTFHYGEENQPPMEAALRFINDTLPPLADYLVAGFETAPTTNQAHVQGYVQFTKRKRLTELKKLPDAGTIHWEVAKGDEIQNREYCLKDCGEDFVEIGEARCVNGRVQEKKRWDTAKALAKTGDLDDICPQIYVSHYSSLRNIARDHLGCSADADDVTGIWIYGDSGTGKSHWARQQYGGGTDKLYLKPINKWWDGFRKGQHENVLLEDMEPSQSILGYHLKIWADRYSFPAEIKGSTIQIRPKKIIVTSQYHPALIWTDTETQTAILRRFKVLKKSSQDLPPVEEALTEKQRRELIFVQPETASNSSSAATNVRRDAETEKTSSDAQAVHDTDCKQTVTCSSPEQSTDSKITPTQCSTNKENELPMTTLERQQAIPLIVSTETLQMARALGPQGLNELARALGLQQQGEPTHSVPSQ